MRSKLALGIFEALLIVFFGMNATYAQDLSIGNSQKITNTASYDNLTVEGRSKTSSWSGSGERGELSDKLDRQMQGLLSSAGSSGKLEVAQGANLNVGNLNIGYGVLTLNYFYHYMNGDADGGDISGSRTRDNSGVINVTGGYLSAKNANIGGFYEQTGGSVQIDQLNSEHYRELYTTTFFGETESTANVTLNGGQLYIKNLDSDASVRASAGTLQVDYINLNKKTLELSGAQLKTKLNQIADFKKVVEKAQTLLMGSNDAAKTVNATAIGSHDEVNGILSKFKNNVYWKSGSFYFTGSYSQSLANTASALIKSTFGSGVNVQFERITANPTPAEVTNGLTAAIANAVISENGQTAGLIFRQYAFDARNNDLIVGQSGGVTTSVGFTHLNGSHGATVTGGKTLALLGQGGSNTIASGILTANNGTLRLGTTNTGVTVGGVVNSVELTNNGVLNTVRGSYTVKDLSGKGTVNVDSGILNLHSATFTGSLNNKGTLNLGADFDLYTGTNNGTLNVSTVEINDVFTNTGSANISGAWNFGTNGRYQHTAGTLTTIQDNLFENVNFSEIDPLNTITLGQSIPQDIKTTMTELFQKYVPGNVVESIAQHATFNGGKVIVSGVNLTETMVDDLTRAFKETFFIRFPKAFPQLSALWLWA